MTKSAAKNVLLLGATGGVGQAAGRLLLKRGWRVIAAFRRPGDDARLLESDVCSDVLKLDLDRPDDIDGFAQRLAAHGVDALHGLVNCAAVTEPRPLELSPIANVRRTFEVNLFAPLHLVQTTLPLLRAAQGRIVLVSSTSGMLGVPLLGAYSASKFALEGVADVLRRELKPWRVTVSLIIPGGIRTPMIDRQLAQIDADLAALETDVEIAYAPQYRQHRTLIELAARSAVSPERVAEDALRALTERRPRARYLCGAAAHGTGKLRLMPDAVLDQLFQRLPGSHKT